MLEFEAERDKHKKAASYSKERLSEFEKDRKDLADEYVVLKTNYLALTKEHQKEVSSAHIYTGVSVAQYSNRVILLNFTVESVLPSIAITSFLLNFTIDSALPNIVMVSFLLNVTTDSSLLSVMIKLACCKMTPASTSA